MIQHYKDTNVPELYILKWLFSYNVYFASIFLQYPESIVTTAENKMY